MASIWENTLGVPVERNTQYDGMIYVRAGRNGADGFTVQLFLPIAGTDGLHARVEGTLPEGWADRVASCVRAHNTPNIGDLRAPDGWQLPSGHYFPPPHYYPGAPEIGDLGSTLTGLLGPVLGGIGTALGGPAGGLAGAGLGSLLSGALGGGSAPAARPSSLPAPASAANRLRILQFLGVTPGMPASQVLARLRDGATRQWAAEDLTDDNAMIPIVQAMGEGPIASLETISNAGAPASSPDAMGALAALLGSQGNVPTNASDAAQTALAALLGGASTGAQVSPILAAVQALQRGTALAVQPAGAAALGSLTPEVIALMGDGMGLVSKLARGITGDPTALAVVDAAVQQASAKQANAVSLVRSMLGALS